MISLSREESFISKLLKDLEEGKLGDSRLAYVLGRYIELKKVYEYLSWHLMTEITRSGISGAQVFVGFLNLDLVIGLFSFVIALGSIIFTIMFPEYRVHALISTIISTASTVACLGHYFLRIKKGIAPEIAKR